ncbi:hypothetical protein RR48_03425 [Papilio machaon]|uniref:Uncharacterized protein n=1 Tax=Papilio machaon TaxID=76193 RepID=A0A0N1IFD4_PAPMA|nr:hypothetical protein RR48_03425 [Papilio machaon]
MKTLHVDDAVFTKVALKESYSKCSVQLTLLHSAHRIATLQTLYNTIVVRLQFAYRYDVTIRPTSTACLEL